MNLNLLNVKNTKGQAGTGKASSKGEAENLGDIDNSEFMAMLQMGMESETPKEVSKKTSPDLLENLLSEAENESEGEEGELLNLKDGKKEENKKVNATLLSLVNNQPKINEKIVTEEAKGENVLAEDNNTKKILGGNLKNQQLVKELKSTQVEKTPDSIEKLLASAPKLTAEQKAELLNQASMEKLEENQVKKLGGEAQVRKSFFPNAKKVVNNTELADTKLNIKEGGSSVPMASVFEPNQVPSKTFAKESNLSQDLFEMRQQFKSKPNEIGLKQYQKQMVDNGAEITKGTIKNPMMMSAQIENSEVPLKAKKESNVLDFMTGKEIPLESLKATPTFSKEVAATEAPKVLQMGGDNNQTKQIISKVADYIYQQGFNKRGNFGVMVNHEDLGRFNIDVKKLNDFGDIKMEIKTSTQEGGRFFSRHEGELMRSLNESGLKILDIKVSNSMDLGPNIGGDKRSGENSGFLNGNSQHGDSYTSNQRQREDQDTQRRKDLWENYREKLGA